MACLESARFLNLTPLAATTEDGLWPDQCGQIIAMAEDSLQRATVVNKNGAGEVAGKTLTGGPEVPKPSIHAVEPVATGGTRTATTWWRDGPHSAR